METKDFKKTKGITLISLVVSIVVLLILAGISIVTLTGDNGLLNKTISAKNKTTLVGMEEELNLAYMSIYTGKAGSGAINSRVSLDEIYNDANLSSQIKGHIRRLGGVSRLSLVDSNQSSISLLAEADAITTAGTVGTNTVSIQVKEEINSNSYWLESEGIYYPMSIQNSRVVLDKENTSTTEPTGEGSLGSGIVVKYIDSEATEETSTSSYISKDISKSGEITTITLTATEAGSTQVIIKNGDISLSEGNINVIISPVYTINIGDMENGSIEITTRGNDTTSYTKYECGTVIQLNAIGDTTPQRYEFQKWNDNTVTNPREITVNSITATSTVVYTATFQISTSEIAKGINSETYGKYVNYNIDLGIGTANDVTDDWKVFYDDGNNIYIIAADYVPVSNTYLATAMSNMGGVSNGSSYPYCVKWSSNTSFKTYKNGTTSTAATGAADIFTSRPTGTAYLEERGFLGFWKSQTISTANGNAKMTASLMDTKVWEGFAGGLPSGVTGTAYAIGGPTVSMWVESWNVTRKTKLYYNNVDESGYRIGTSCPPYSTSISLSSTIDYSNIKRANASYTDDLYFPRTQRYNNCDGYWLASPSAGGNAGIMYVYYNGSFNYAFYNVESFCVRPVVCLPSNIKLEIDRENSNLYNITNVTIDNNN